MTPQDALLKAKIALMSRSNTAFFTTVLFNLELEFDNQVPTAVTNGTYIKFNEQFFMSLSQEERVFLLVHEAMHVAYMHMLRGTSADVNQKLFNMAADYVINLELVNRGFVMPACGLLDQQYANMSTEQVYERLKQEAEDDLPEFSMEDLQAPGDESKEAKDALAKEIENLLIKAHTQSKMSGDRPGSIPGELEVFINSLLVPLLPWYKILYKYMNSIVKDDYSYRRPNKRYMPEMYLPSLYSEGMGEICIAIDISGSVTDYEFKQFITEIKSIFGQLKPAAINLVLFDTEIKSVTKLHNVADLMQVRFVGRGGTHIQPVLKYIQEKKPQITVVLTDGDFSIPQAKIRTPLIWLIHNNPKFSINYGQTIHYKI